MGCCVFTCMQTSSLFHWKYSLCFKHYMTNSSYHTPCFRCVAVLQMLTNSVCSFFKDNSWTGSEMSHRWALFFFFISKVEVLLFIWRPPTAGLSLLSASTLPGAGRDPEPFSSSLQYRVNLWAARGSGDQSWDPQVTGWPAASPLLTCIRSERKYLYQAVRKINNKSDKKGMKHSEQRLIPSFSPLTQWLLACFSSSSLFIVVSSSSPLPPSLLSPLNAQ